MSYITYELNGARHVGELDGDIVTPLEGVTEIGSSTPMEVLEAATRRPNIIALADVRLLPVSPHPGKVICIGLNYRDHVIETKRELPTYPVMFPKYASSLLGARDAIVLPPESKQVDYEGELAIVIGRAGRRIDQSQALNHVLGYSVANDITMRDFQYKTHQWLQGKAWDASTPIGPAIVTPGEVDITSSGIRTLLNGEKVQESDLSQLIFSITDLVSTISTFTTLRPGDIILSGTPGGVGYRRDPQRLLRPGDRVTVEIDGVGAISNDIVADHPHSR